ncbi:MAG: hypothetical protein IJ829_01660, partial [Kiritimatiellae bacterium]|nr:hypothetical protein [Kiritimatiellia bacterium]
KIVSTTNAPVYRVTARGAAGKDGVVRFSLPVVNTVRGPARVLLSVKGEKRGEAVLIDRLQTFDDLLTIETPHYRGTVSTMRRKAAVEFAFRLNPAAEKLFRGGYHRAKVVAPDGQTVVASTKRARFSGLRGSLSLDVPQDAAAGTYSVHVEVTSATDKKRHVASAPFKIAAPMETQVLADQDNVLLRGGKPWFPLGMYHAQPEFWQEVHDLGIDLQQSMNWLDGDFPRLAAMKQPLLYETKHRWPENFAIWTKRLSVEPYAAMWYIADEPRDDLVWRWEACHRAAAENDPDHPTFSVLLHPTSFAYQKGISDLLAVDVYPLGRDGSGDLFEIQRKIRLCRQAVNDEKPVLAVLQSFGFESTDKFRVMAYLAVVSGAKGILWYPWQEGEPAVGVNTNPALKAALRSLTGELKGLAPAVLSLSTEELSLADGKVPALLCGDKTTGVKLICVNPTNARVAAPAPKVKGLRLPATIEVPAYGVVVL